MYLDKEGKYCAYAYMQDNRGTILNNSFAPYVERQRTNSGVTEKTIPNSLEARFDGEGFPLKGKNYPYASRDEYFAAVEHLVKDMEKLGFEVVQKEENPMLSPRLDIRFAHKETRPFADRQAEEEREREAKEQRRYEEKLASGEKGYIRFGDMPEGGKSFNYRDKIQEPGVSVYRAVFYEDGTYDVLYGNPFLWFGAQIYRAHRPAYRVWGTETGTGSDGEPCLAVQKFERLEEIQYEDEEKKENGY